MASELEGQTSYTAHAMLWLNGDGNCSEHMSEHSLLTDCVNDEQLKTVMRAPNETGYRNPRTHRIEQKWHWLNCDGGFLTWAHRNRHTHVARHQYFWFLEWDVAWSGRLLPYLRANAHRTDDLLCPKYERMRSSGFWVHSGKRNRTRFLDSCIAHCQSSVVRVSRRLLLHTLEEMGQHQSFCEMRMANRASTAYRTPDLHQPQPCPRLN